MSEVKVLIIDDEDMFREDFATLLSMKKFQTKTASTAEIGLESLTDFTPEIIFCDINLPGKQGIDIIEDLKKRCPETQVIMITAFGNLQNAVDSFRKGAADYILKPLVIDDVVRKINFLVEHNNLNREIQNLREIITEKVTFNSLLGNSKEIEAVRELISKVAPTKSTVLICGESGTGKELVAREIHKQSEKPKEPFIAINCAGIPEQLLESELFGHVKGSFTGAISDRKGQFELAASGTVFLDEMGEMPISLQNKLLRVLEQKEFTPVGGNTSLPLLSRVVSATSKKLKPMVEAEEFSDALYYRLAVFEIEIPPLRDRKKDIPMLAEFFVKKLKQEMKRQCLGFDNHAMKFVISYNWPGNIRQLRNTIERALILLEDKYITIDCLPAEIRDCSSIDLKNSVGDNFREAVKVFEKKFISQMIEKSDGNKEEAARKMGINPSTLHRKISDLKIEK